jgi:hypothetical protein
MFLYMYFTLNALRYLLRRLAVYLRNIGGSGKDNWNHARTAQVSFRYLSHPPDVTDGLRASEGCSEHADRSSFTNSAPLLIFPWLFSALPTLIRFFLSSVSRSHGHICAGVLGFLFIRLEVLAFCSSSRLHTRTVLSRETPVHEAMHDYASDPYALFQSHTALLPCCTGCIFCRIFCLTGCRIFCRTGRWELVVHGKNGVTANEKFIAPGHEPHKLTSKERLQVC